MWLPQTANWRLNERHYGALQGLNKAETAAKHGDEQVKIWRRSFDVPPPPLALDDPMHPSHDPRYAGVPPSCCRRPKSLKITLDRVMPYWGEAIAPQLREGRNVLVAAHGNSLRALAKHLFEIGDQDIIGLEIPTGNPILIELDRRAPAGQRALPGRGAGGQAAAALTASRPSRDSTAVHVRSGASPSRSSASGRPSAVDHAPPARGLDRCRCGVKPVVELARPAASTSPRRSAGAVNRSS